MASGGDNDVSISPQNISKIVIAGGVGALSSDKKSKKISLYEFKLLVRQQPCI